MGESFTTLREEGRLFDVTLATDDGQHIQAHKMVLSAGSHFFSDIFMKTNHSNMLIYLKGVSSAELEPVTDFLYNGEAFITQEYLTAFLGTAKELQIKGLLGDLEGTGENTSETQKSAQQHGEYIEKLPEYENSNDMGAQESILDSSEELADSFNTMRGSLVNTDDSKPAMITNHELALQIGGMIEKQEGLWRCKVCGKTATRESQTRRHAETHIEGLSHVCHICSKTCSTRHSLKDHIYNIHSELISCDICGKNGMNRLAYNSHKRKNHTALSIKQ